MTEFTPRYMMGTKAIARDGKTDISRDEYDYCYIQKQEGDNYIGHWVEGLGFFEVRFPIETTRECTPEEKDYAENTPVVII
jgi:hypothetical protein